MADITQRGSKIKDDNGVAVGYLGVSYAGTSPTAIKRAAGFLHSITFGTPIAANIINIYDSTGTQDGTLGTITFPATPQPVTLLFDINFTRGLTISAGTAPSATLSYV